MKKLILILLLSLNLTSLKSQNGLGFSLGYANLNASNWNNLLEKYNSSDTVQSKQPFLKHAPHASIIYERKLAEFFYLQLDLFCSYTYSSSKQNGNLNWKILAPGIGLNIHWYPFKMIKGMSQTAWNPIAIEGNFGSSYLLKTLTLNNNNVNPISTNAYNAQNIAFHFGGGIGYDLHFGKRIIVQTMFDVNVYPEVNMQELDYFIPEFEKLGFSTQSSVILLGGKISLLFLFKGLGGRSKNNINSKRSMFK